jgi:predicted RNase H-like HicB family nuclease
MSEKKRTPRAKQNNSISVGSIASLMWGTILWLFAILSEMWVSRTITMIIAVIGTLLWAVGLIAICRTAINTINTIHTCSSCKYYSVYIQRDMFTKYIQAALRRAQYKLINNNNEPCFADVPELDGVWAMGHTIEDARRELIEVLEEWIAARLTWGLPIPPIGGQSIEVSKKT